MAQIGSLNGKDGKNIYPGTIPQAVIDPSTKKNLRTELDELYNESIVMEEDETEVPDVETIAADTATKSLQDWDGNDIRNTYLKRNGIAVVTEAQYTALGDAVNSNGVIYFITE